MRVLSLYALVFIQKTFCDLLRPVFVVVVVVVVFRNGKLREERWEGRAVKGEDAWSVHKE